MGTEKRERQKEGHRLHREELKKWEKRRANRRRLTIWGSIIVVGLGAAFLYSAVLGDEEQEDAACPPAAGVDQPVPTFTAPPPTCTDPTRQYTAVFDTTEGEIRVALDTENTPDTVNNFVVLSRYGYYDGTPIFRTDPSIGIIQGGGESAGDPGPGYVIPDEGTGYTYEAGQLVMARGDQGAGAQFFFVANEAAEALAQDGGAYVVFGNADRAGLRVVRAILDLHREDPTSELGGAPRRAVTVNSVTIQES